MAVVLWRLLLCCGFFNVVLLRLQLCCGFFSCVVAFSVVLLHFQLCCGLCSCVVAFAVEFSVKALVFLVCKVLWRGRCPRPLRTVVAGLFIDI